MRVGVDGEEDGEKFNEVKRSEREFKSILTEFTAEDHFLMRNDSFKTLSLFDYSTTRLYSTTPALLFFF